MRKLQQLGTFLTTLTLALFLTSVNARAVTFHDIDKHWAKQYIEKMEKVGLAKGWQETDANGVLIYRFDPDRAMTYAETLLFCSRVMDIDDDLQAEMEDKWRTEVRRVLPESVASWTGAVREFSVAVETGIITLDELEALKETNPSSVQRDAAGKIVSSNPYLQWYITREELCRYLIRAMQMEPLAQSLELYPLEYEDTESISPDLRPYVYLLTYYKVVEGNESGGFAPQRPVTRAEMITMVSRILDTMDELGIVVELSEYTDYDWTAGVIQAASQLADSSSVVTLENIFTGAQTTYSIPSDAKIYADNMAGTTADLAEGAYARLNLNSSGKVTSVRVGGPLTSYEGDVASLADGVLALSGEGFQGSMRIDRFTQTAVGGREVDRSLLDDMADYAQAQCWVDKLGHLAGVCFRGGTHTMEGLIWDVEREDDVTKLDVVLFNGEHNHYTLSPNCAVSVNGAVRTLTSDDAGRYILLRVKNDASGEVENAVVDTTNRYIQGPVTATGRVGDAISVTIRDIFTHNTARRSMDRSVNIAYYNALGRLEEKAPNQIETSWYVTARVGTGKERGYLVAMTAYPNTLTREGTLTDIQRGEETVLELSGICAGIVEYDTLDMHEPPTIARNGAEVTVADLRLGDRLKLTFHHGNIVQIEATPEVSTTTGVLFAVNRGMDGATIQIQLTDGVSETYAVADTVAITLDGNTASLSSLKPGQAVALTVENGVLVSISGTASATSGSMINGKVWQLGSKMEEGFYLLLDDSVSTPLRVELRSDTKFLSAATGSDRLSWKDLKLGDNVTVLGNNEAGVLHATIIIIVRD